MSSTVRPLPVALLLAAVAVVGCGRASEVGADPAQTPAGAVQRLIDGSSSRAARADRAHAQRFWDELADLCRTTVSPDVREGFEFEPQVKASPKSCGPVLALLLFYPGDTGDVPYANNFAGRATATRMVGTDEAVVRARMTYLGPTGKVVARHATNVLAVRRDGRWWVATPGSLNIRWDSAATTDDALRAEYERERGAARTAHARHTRGRDATRPIRALTQCPSAGRTSAADRARDVRLSDGMRLAPTQPGAADLVAVRESRDGDQLCFELQFAGAPAAEGYTDLITSTGRVHVSWSPGRVVGQVRQDHPRAVAVDASAGDRLMTFRVPTAAFRAPGPGRPYRWAAELFVEGAGQRSLYDSVPDNLTLSGPDGDNLIAAATR